jgi:hypothetical protein
MQYGDDEHYYPEPDPGRQVYDPDARFLNPPGMVPPVFSPKGNDISPEVLAAQKNLYMGLTHGLGWADSSLLGWGAHLLQTVDDPTPPPDLLEIQMADDEGRPWADDAGATDSDGCVIEEDS